MASRVPSDTQIDDALAREFTDYLGDVSRTIIDPIRKHVDLHKSEVDRLIKSTTKLKGELESFLSSNASEFGRNSAQLILNLQAFSEDTRAVIACVSTKHDETRAALMDAAETVLTEVRAGISSLDALTSAARTLTAKGIVAMRGDLKRFAEAAQEDILGATRAEIERRGASIATDVGKLVDHGVGKRITTLERQLARLLSGSRWFLLTTVIQTVVLIILAYKLL